MKPPVPLATGERILFTSARGGDAGHSSWWWLLAIFGGMQVCNGLMFAVHALANPTDSLLPGGPVVPLLGLLGGAVALGRWIQLKIQPAYVVTSQRIIARRVFLPAITFAPEDVGAAARFLIKHMRYGRVVREQLTNTLVVALRSGGTRRFGPVKDADTLVVLLTGLAQGVIDVRALPGVGGELSAAETRRDLFFARTTRTGGAERGPLFVGPRAVIGFAAELTTSRMLQLYTIVGSQRPAEDIEARMIALAENTEFGRAVVMKREGTTLTLDGKRLLLASETNQVAFDLSPEDARRAEAQLPKNEAHPYR
jgi:hypothetical protein